MKRAKFSEQLTPDLKLKKTPSELDFFDFKKSTPS